MNIKLLSLRLALLRAVLTSIFSSIFSLTKSLINCGIIKRRRQQKMIKIPYWIS